VEFQIVLGAPHSRPTSLVPLTEIYIAHILLGTPQPDIEGENAVEKAPARKFLLISEVGKCLSLSWFRPDPRIRSAVEIYGAPTGAVSDPAIKLGGEMQLTPDER
jgi:hypothetical protein